MNEIAKAVTEMQEGLAIDGRAASLRYTAKFLGVSHGTLQNWLTGEYRPNRATAEYMEKGARWAFVTAKKILDAVPADPVVEAEEKSVS